MSEAEVGAEDGLGLQGLKIWGAGVYSPRSYAAEFVVFLSVCPSRYDARHTKPRRSVYALNLGERA